MITYHPGRSPRRSSKKFPSTKFWLIAKHEKGSMEVFTLDPDGRGSKGTLPVFSFEEEDAFIKRLYQPHYPLPGSFLLSAPLLRLIAVRSILRATYVVFTLVLCSPG